MHENREISSTPWSDDHQKPYCGHARAGEVGLCRSTCEPTEQGRATFRGGWGGKGTDEGEHRSIAHAPDTERSILKPGFILLPRYAVYSGRSLALKRVEAVSE